MNENDLMDVCLSKIKYPINDDSAYWKIIKSLRELLKIKDFDKITVIEICKNSNVSRKTFYDNFRDKNDIVEKIILQNIIKPFIQMNEMFSKNRMSALITIEWLFQQFYDDREFYEKIYDFTGQNSFKDLIIKCTHAIALYNLEEIEMSEIEKNYMAYFYSTSHAMLLIKWIQDKMVVPPKTMASYYKKWTLPLWEEIYAKKQNNDG